MPVNKAFIALLTLSVCVPGRCKRCGLKSLGWEDLLKEGIAAHSSILAWRIPWAEEPGRLQSIGLLWVRHDWSDLACTHMCLCLSALHNIYEGRENQHAYVTSYLLSDFSNFVNYIISKWFWGPITLNPFCDRSPHTCSRLSPTVCWGECLLTSIFAIAV